MTRPDRESLIAEAMLHPHAEARYEWWRGAMFYEVYVRSFRDTDADGVGDIRGVIEKLDYVRSLEVDGLWLSPFYPSPQVDFGYDILDFCNVDPLFGRMEDVIELISAAHEHDLKLLLDIVPGHTSDQHPWFQESRKDRENPKADWYIWADAAEDGGPPNNWLSSFGGPAWQWEPRRSQYYYHPFLTCQPALDLRNPEALGAILDVLRFWLDKGVDGFRLDAVQCLCCDPALRSNPPSRSGESNVMVGGGPNNPFRRQQHLFDRDVPEAIDVLAAMRETVAGYQPERVLIGELADVDSSHIAAKYTVPDERLHAVYDFDLINAANSLGDWREILRVRSKYMASGWAMNVLTNHDSVRAVSNLTAFAVQAGESVKAAKLLLLLQSTLVGGGIVFQGDELGLTQPRLDYDDLQDPWGKNLWPDFEGRDGVRTPMPWHASAPHAGFSEAEEVWLPVPEEHAARAVDVQDHDPDSVLEFFRAIQRWRRQEPLLRTGKERVHQAGATPVIAFDRYDDARCLTIAVNVSLGEQWFALEDGDTPLDLAGCVGERSDGGISLPPLRFAMIERAGQCAD